MIDPNMLGHLAPEAKASLDRYAEHGIPTGDCYRAILSGNLFEAFARADPQTAHLMPYLVAYITAKLPNGCWGREDLVDGWIETHRARLQRDREARRE